MKKNNLVIASMVMLVFSIISKISGFLRELVFAYFYGASNITDAYIAATTISTTLFAGITVAVATSYIPIISKANEKNISKITSNILNTVILIVFSVSILGTIFIDQLIPFVAVGFEPEKREITAQMARIILPFSCVYSVSNILSSFLQFKNTFWTIGVSVVINNFINMIAFAVSGGNLNVLAIGFVMSWVMPAVFFLGVAIKKGYRYSCAVDFKEDTLKTIIKLGIPIFLGQLVFQFNTIVDRNFASMLGEGTMTAMKYANQLNLFVLTIFVISITTAIFPTLSSLYSEEKIDEFKKISKNTINTVMMFVLPITIAFFILAKPIVELVFMRGEFDMDAAIITSNSLMIYAFAIPGISMNEILNKQFYAIKDTKTPVLASCISLGSNIILNFIFIEKFGYMGLCAATAIANSVLAIILYIKLNKKIGGFDTKNIIINLSKMTFASIIMGVVVKITLQTLSIHTNDFGTLGTIINLGVCAIFGALTYFLVILILKVPEVKTAIEFVKNKLSKKA